MTITLPYPPPVNRLYRVVRGRPILSSEARSYRSAVAARCLTARPRMLATSDDVAVTLRLYRPRRAGDIDGPLKLLLDCLEGFAFKNDRQVCRLVVERFDDKAAPRVEVEILPQRLLARLVAARKVLEQAPTEAPR